MGKNKVERLDVDMTTDGQSQAWFYRSSSRFYTTVTESSRLRLNKMLQKANWAEGYKLISHLGVNRLTVTLIIK
jgi:hypothetical protein